MHFAATKSLLALMWELSFEWQSSALLVYFGKRANKSQSVIDGLATQHAARPGTCARAE